jgi:hypothetical protein
MVVWKNKNGIAAWTSFYVRENAFAKKIHGCQVASQENKKILDLLCSQQA